MTPTVIIGVGPFGRAVLARLGAEAQPPARLLKSFPLREEAPDTWSQLPALFQHQLKSELEDLLRGSAAGASGATGRLDLILVADLAEADGSPVVAVANLLSTVLRDHFSVMFRPDASPEERGVGLVAVLATPPLDASPAGRKAITDLSALERWHASGPPSPILSRIYVLPSQNEAMPLSREDLVRGAFLFVSTAWAPELRHESPIADWLRPSGDGRLLGSFTVAAADVDVPRVLEAFAWRSAVTGFERLAARCDAPALGDQAEAVAGALVLDEWCRPLAECALARRTLPRKKDLDDALVDADRAEAEARAAARRGIREVVDEQLKAEGLTAYPLLARGLETAAERIAHVATAAATGWLPPATASATVPVGPALPAGGPPRPSWLASLAAGAALLVATAAAGSLVATASSARRMQQAYPSGISVKSGARPAMDYSPLLWGLAAGSLVAVAWIALGRLRIARERVANASAEPARPDTATASNSAALEMAVALRRRRVARDAHRLLCDEAARVEALHGAVLEALSRSRDRLRTLGVEVGDKPGNDDYGRLFDAGTVLHRALLDPTVLPGLWVQSREFRDDDSWAAELLRCAWPKTGLQENLPFDPDSTWEEVRERQHQSLRDKGVFSWPGANEILPAKVDAFLETVPKALSYGVRPVRPDRTPEPLAGAGDLLVVAPLDGRPLVEQSRRTHGPDAASTVPADSKLSRLVVLGTASGFDAASLERGLT